MAERTVTGRGAGFRPFTTCRSAPRGRRAGSRRIPGSWRHDHDALQVESREVRQVVRQDLVDALLACAVGVKRVIYRAAREAERRDLAEDGALGSRSERHDREPAEQRVFGEEARLIGRDAVRWSRLFGQSEGRNKVYRDCEVKPSGTSYSLPVTLVEVHRESAIGPRRSAMATVVAARGVVSPEGP